MLVVYSVRAMASCPVLFALKVRLPTSKVDNCNEVSNQLPHRAHFSRASCLKNQAERNDVLVFSVRVQNVQAYARGPIVI